MLATIDDHAARNGVKLHYRVFGAGDETVVLLPGWDNGADEWGSLIDSLVAIGYRCVWIDPRGTGASDHPRHQWTMRDNARDVAAVLDQLQIARADLVGHSYGGKIAQAVAAWYPQRVHRLVLVGTAPPFPFRLPTREGIKSILRGVQTVPASAEDARDSPAAAPPPDHRRAIVSMLTDRRHELRRIAAPTLVVHGSADDILPPSNGRTLARRIRGALLAVVEGGTHEVLNTPLGAWTVTAVVIPFLRGTLGHQSVVH